MKIHILEVMSGLSAGGAETMMMNILRNINRDKFQIDFLIFESEASFYTEEVKFYGCNIFMVPPIRKVGVRRYIKEIKKIINKNGPFNVVHSHLDIVSALVMIAAKQCKVPIRISHSHSTAACIFKKNINSLAMFFIRRIFSLYATKFFACSRDAANFMFGKKNGKKAVVINNAIDLERFSNKGQYDKERISQNLNILTNKFIITNIARFTHVKNQKFLIDVFFEFHKLNSESILLLVGDGELRKELQAYSINKGIGDDVCFLGERKDVAEILSVTDVFALPSLFEGAPVTLIEAQAMDVPCIISDKITNQVDCGLDLLQYISIDSVSNWVSALNTLSCRGLRKDNSLIMQKKGYDICRNIAVIEREYERGDKLKLK